MELIAAITGESLVQMVIWVIVIGLICGLLWWLISYIGLAAPFDKVARVIVAVVAVVLLINALLLLVGKPFITF